MSDEAKRRVAEMLEAGLTVRDIAVTMGVSERAVRELIATPKPVESTP